jgi:prepilin-type N-terminal cleavage/methylation domain-containing protein
MMSPTGIAKNKLRSERAFTLIELIFVILLVSVITGLSTPVFKRTAADFEIRSVARRIAQSAQYAQEMAILERVVYKLNLDTEKSSLRLMKNDGTTGRAAAYRNADGRYGKVFSLPGDLQISCALRELFFYPDGRCDEARISLAGKNGEVSDIWIKGFVNQIEIEETNHAGTFFQ